MQTLSSSITPFTKFVLPGGFLAALPLWIFQIQDPRFGCLPALSWAAACAFLVWWTAPIKKVSLRGDEFVISNYRREVVVPVSSLLKISEGAGNRTPNIALIFDPPTSMGRKVRIVVPWDFSRREFDRIAKILHQIIEKNAQPGGTDNSGDSPLRV
jgi:hypothetical protein